MRFDYVPRAAEPARLGLIVLQSDERIESDFRRLLPGEADLFVSRIPSGADVTPETLKAMERYLTQAAGLLPKGRELDVIGYGCTSGTAQIGAARVAAQIRRGAATGQVTEPVSALVAACAALGIGRLALLSPYVAEVSARLREVLNARGVATPVFGSFEEGEEARVVRIAPDSIVEAGCRLARAGEVDGIFVSCTNLDTLDAIARIEADVGLPVLSSNQVLAWHMCRLAGLTPRKAPALAALARACGGRPRPARLPRADPAADRPGEEGRGNPGRQKGHRR